MRCRRECDGRAKGSSSHGDALEVEVDGPQPFPSSQRDLPSATSSQAGLSSTPIIHSFFLLIDTKRMNKINDWSSYLVPFYSLQYPTDRPERTDSFHNSAYYNVGPLDICFVITCIAIMAILRDALRLGFFEPFARWVLHRELSWKIQQRTKAASAINGTANGNGHVTANGNGNGSTNGKANGSMNGKANGSTNGKANGSMNGKANGSANGHASIVAASGPTTKELRQLNRKVMRFAEQGWSVVYYTVQWSFGLYVHYNLPTRVLHPVDLWIDYPHIPIAGTVKVYYLTQSAFYLHQILILNAEARRKDHFQMMAHHIVTVILMLTSYLSHFTRVGSVIMVLMDCCDIFLPLGKMMLYLDIRQVFCDCVFGIFMLSWFITRHILSVIVIWSTIFEGPKYIEFKWDWEGGYYVTESIYRGFWIMLLFLQALQVIWFGMIARVAYQIATGRGASDVRSDDEGGDTKKDD